MSNLLFLVLFSLMAESRTLKVATTDFPPFQYTENNRVKGITTEIVEHVIKGAGYNANIKSYPWARALKLGNKEPEILIYSIVRSPERENKFKWIGVIAPFNTYFWKLKIRKDIQIASIEDAKNYKNGTTSGDIRAERLIALGIIPGKNLEIEATDLQNIRRLYAGKIDLITQDVLSFRHIVEAEKLNYSLFEKLIFFDGSSRELQLAASLGTSDEVVEKLRASLVNFKKTKKYQEIKNHIK